MPNWKKLVGERIASLRLQPTAESELTEELAQDLEDRYKELLSGGATEEEAYRKAAAELDDMQPIKAECGRSQQMPKHDVVPVGDPSTTNFMADLWGDLLYGQRKLRKNQVFVLVVDVTVGLGLGADYQA